MSLTKDFDDVVKKLEDEVKSNNSKDEIDKLIQILSQDLEKLSKTNSFYQLPLTTIFLVLSNENICIDDDNISFLKIIIHNVIKNHKEEKETIFLLQILKTNQNIALDDLICLLEDFTDSPILKDIVKQYKYQNQDVEVDYQYEIESKEKIIKNKNEEIEKLENEKALLKQDMEYKDDDYPPITKKPDHFNSDLLKACEKGDFESIRYLIEIQGEDKEKRNRFGSTPLHIASRYGYFPIVRYLVKKQNAFIDSQNDNELTPLHFACEEGFYDIVKYLVVNGANINIRDMNGRPPIFYAIANSHDNIIQYLLNKGAEYVDQDDDGFTATDYNLTNMSHF